MSYVVRILTDLCVFVSTLTLAAAVVVAGDMTWAMLELPMWAP